MGECWKQTARFTFCVVVFILSLLVLISAHDHSASTEPGFLFKEGFHSTKIGLPFTLTIGLLGLEGNGENAVELAPSVLQDILTRSYPTHVPSAINKAKQLDVAFDIKYGVHHVAHFSITQIESLLSRSMQYMETVEDCMMYEVDFFEIQSWIDRIYTDGLAQVAGTAGIDRYSHSPNDEHISNLKPAVIVIAPSKYRMRPSLPPDAINATKYAYYYRYHRSAPTQVIVGGLRYVFVDLSAGPVPLLDGEARISDTDLTVNDIVPRPERIDIDELTELQLRSASGRSPVVPSRASTLMVAELMTVLVNSVKYVFLPDMLYRSLPYSETIIVPIIVLRNHQHFDPWRQEGGEETLLEGAEGPVNDFKIDLQAIKQQIEPLLLATSVRVIFTTSMHSLSDFPKLRTALNSSTNEDTLYQFSIRSERVESRQLEYLNSTTLLESTMNAVSDDELVLLGNFAEFQSKSHRVFPVFVYSLLGYPNDLLMDRTGFHVANEHAAVILQTDADAIPTRYQSQDGVLTMNAQRSTLHIIAALMSSLCAITPSNIHMDHKHRIVHSYLFSIGSHPFPPFATEQSTIALSSSLIYRDTAIRNAVIMRVTAGLRSVHRTVKALDHAIDHFGSHLIGFNDGPHGALFTLWSQQKLRTSLSVPDDDNNALEDEFEAFLTTSVNSLLGLERTFRKLIEHIQDPYSASGFEFDMLHQLAGLTYTESRRFERSVQSSLQSFNETYSSCTFTWTLDKESPHVEQQRMSFFTLLLWICSLAALSMVAFLVAKHFHLFDSQPASYGYGPYGPKPASTLRTKIAIWSRNVPGRQSRKLHGV